MFYLFSVTLLGTSCAVSGRGGSGSLRQGLGVLSAGLVEGRSDIAKGEARLANAPERLSAFWAFADSEENIQLRISVGSRTPSPFRSAAFMRACASSKVWLRYSEMSCIAKRQQLDAPLLHASIDS